MNHAGIRVIIIAIILASSTGTLAQQAGEIRPKESNNTALIEELRKMREVIERLERRVSELEAEIRRLRRENAILQEEREILKKATAYFAKESL